MKILPKGFSLKQEAIDFLKDVVRTLLPEGTYKALRDFFISVIAHDVRKATRKRVIGVFERRLEKKRIEAIKMIDRLIDVNTQLGWKINEFKTLEEAMSAGMDELHGVRVA